MRKIPFIIVFLVALTFGAFLVLPAADVLDAIPDESESQPLESSVPLGAGVQLQARALDLNFSMLTATPAGDETSNSRSDCVPVHPTSNLTILLDRCLRR
jgi:hypothetical protein